MLENKTMKRLIALILVFTMTFGNFAFVSKAYASSWTENFFGSKANRSIEFNSYFETEDGNTTSVISDVNNKDLAIQVDLSITDIGYLKNGKITLKEAEEGKGINFKLKSQDEIYQEIIEADIPEEENVVQEEQDFDESQLQEDNELQEGGEDIQEDSQVDEEMQEDDEQQIENENVQEDELILDNSQVDETNQENDESQIEKENEPQIENENISKERNYIESIDDNTLFLKQIAGYDKTARITIPIEYKNEEYVNEENLSKSFKVELSGTFVNDDGDEDEVTKEIDMRLAWRSTRNINVETDATQFIDYGSGVILQNAIRIDNTSEGNTLPVKETQLVVNPPLLDGIVPSKVNIVANSTAGTNGKTAAELNFNENNWNYNSEENKLTILVSNNKELVQVNEYEHEYLQEKDKEVIEEERYYNSLGVDEYLITYTYDDAEISDEEVDLNSNITANISLLSGDENNELTNSSEYEYRLNGKTGEIVSLNIENKVTEFSKAYMYVNYANSEQYEVEMASETIINVSYKDIVQSIQIEDLENSYINKDGNAIENNDIYYKEISISKENFNNILGENGEIKILNLNGEEIANINNSLDTNEDGNFVVRFEGKTSKIRLETTKPINEGNLVISNTRAIQNASIDKDTLSSIAEMSMKTCVRAKYDYVENLVDIETKEIRTKLNDTITNPSIKLSTDRLATLEENKDVELRIELNNHTDTSDVYGNSVFEIELPKAIESYEITGSSIIYGEGLEISNVETNGNLIRVTVTGNQSQISTGNITNGTNIIINVNMKLNIYTTLKTESIKLRCSNEQATNYENDGISEADVTYSAPTGLVAVNSISNYDNNGAVLTSVKQGYKEGIIPIASEEKTITTDIIVMNNNNNSVSNISILGRVPFEGVKDFITGESLDTTVDSPLVSLINSNNNVEFKIYYSENGEATKDLNDENNKWMENPENLENIKSYLILPVDSKYEMQSGETLRFSYEHKIPEKLSRNKNIYGTYVVDYTNNADGAVVEEQSVPDIVGLTTGEGPEVSLVLFSDREKVKEAEEFYVSLSLSNIGKVVAKNVNIEFPIPENTSYVSMNYDEQIATAELQDNVIRFTKEEMKIDENIEFTVYLKSNSLQTNINAEGTIESENNKIIPRAVLTAEEVGAPIESVGKEILIEQAEFELVEKNRLDSYAGLLDDYYTVGEDIKFDTKVKNLTYEKKTNVVVTRDIPEDFEYKESYVIRAVEKEDGTVEYQHDKESCKYDEATRTLTITLGDMEERKIYTIRTFATIKDFSDSNLVKKEVTTSFTAQADNTEIYESNKVTTVIGRPELEIEQTTDNTDSYLKVGDSIKYKFKIKNVGIVTANNVVLTEYIPEGIIIDKLSYTVGDSMFSKFVSNDQEANIKIQRIEPDQEAIVEVDAIAGSLDGAQERTVSNSASVKGDKVSEKESRQITHIIEVSETNLEGFSSSSSVAQNGSTLDRSNIAQTYKISGTAWVDENKDGSRSNNEKLLSGISVKLVESESGIIQGSVSTDANGNYTFAGIEKGNYLVIFDYDTVKYTVTSYKKEGVSSNVNSDAITTKLEQGGKLRNGAISDVITINTGSISGIDIGLVPADQFDLSLNKTISKITVQTSKDIETDDINNETFVKREIGAKYLSGSTVIVEYTMTVKNEGDVKGYVKKIVDYVPEGMTFNSSHNANKDWYTGSDGNLYSTAFADKELAPGESATIKLVLTKQMTESNTGLSSNKAEIAEDYNIYGISDMNSTPSNEVQGENDLGTAQLFILVKTGETLIYVSVIITSIMIGVVAVFVVYKKIVLKRMKGGV